MLGKHLTADEWNAHAHELYQLEQLYKAKARQLAEALAKKTDADLVASTEFTLAEVGALKAGVNIADARRKVMNGDGSAPVVALAVQFAHVDKFGDL